MPSVRSEWGTLCKVSANAPTDPETAPILYILFIVYHIMSRQSMVSAVLMKE